MSRKKISTTIYVTPEQSERLRLLHERTKVPVAVYIREGIDLVLRQYGHLLPGQLTLASDQASAGPSAAANAGRPEAETKASPLRQERGGAAGPIEPMPERAAGGAGGKS
jgi:ribbon-helix-helix protein